ncbi:MAG: zinc ribbon domain-containing protein [Deltaproteobacteria bacterium]|nr:MAG: zinc ribbon domain-containing protein [Deltaproteobacteria bacterium]
MPIYEYQAVNSERSCPKCKKGFEILQGVSEKPLYKCPECGKKVKKIISWCHSAVTETSEAGLGVERKIKDFEQAGMWSHAAELADKHSEKIKDKGLKMRALDNYKKAGYDADSLAKHAKSDID